MVVTTRAPFAQAMIGKEVNEDFIIEASGGESEDYENVSVDMKQAIYNVMVELHEILSVQDQLKLPN